jgi:acetylornithine deacetylase/succinyl-diaminopimelate desuccinylase-like protein
MFDPIEKLKEFIRFPSVSADSSFADGMVQCREFVANLLAGIGFDVEVVDTPRHPIILGKRDGDPSWPHVVIYGHYDVQPPDPVDLWSSPPFEPTKRDGRLYGRGAADNKGPFMVHVAAVASLLDEYPDLPLRITFLVEGEEEIGSPSFESFLNVYKDRLAGEFVLLSDTGSPSEDQMVITCGLRGIITLDVELTSASGDFHSGMHGGAFLNPIQALAGLCASLHHADGRVKIDGFYDDIDEVAPWEREELSRLGTSEEVYQQLIGVKKFKTLNGVSPFEGIRFHPTLEFNGIGGGYQGEGSKTVIPSSAFVKISCRLVANQDPNKIEARIIAALKGRCPDEVTLTVKPGHKASAYLVVPPGRPNTPPDQSPMLRRVFETATESINSIFGRHPLFLREGGSIPIIADIHRVLKMDSVMIGLCLPEDRLHAPDESFHLGVMEKAIRVSRDILKSAAGV